SASKNNKNFERTLHVPESDSQNGDDLELPIDSERGDKFLGFDTNGKPALINGCAYKSEYIRKQIGGVETLGMIMFKVGDNRPVEWLEILYIIKSLYSSTIKASFL
ncbi:hypothetical protein LCGC14_0190760, partial [marine sediment metagenome]